MYNNLLGENRSPRSPSIFTLKNVATAIIHDKNAKLDDVFTRVFYKEKKFKVFSREGGLILGSLSW